MKGFLYGSLIAALCMPTPKAEAMPTYAWIIANSHCEYLAYGSTWGEAMRQAFRDHYSLYRDEITRDGDMSNRAIAISVQNQCEALNDRAFALHEANN